MLTVFDAIAELERDYILDRQREGIEIAKREGKFKGKQAKDIPNFDAVYSVWKSGDIIATEAMKRLGIKANTFYRRVKLKEQSSI